MNPKARCFGCGAFGHRKGDPGCPAGPGDWHESCPPKFLEKVKKGKKNVFHLRGPVYGQRSAPRAWYRTISKWLVQEAGYEQGRNEPCVFVHPINGHRIVLFCDDFLCRGSKEVSESFYAQLMAAFDCKDPSWLEMDGSITFTGIDIGLTTRSGELVYTMSQSRDMLEFLTQTSGRLA